MERRKLSVRFLLLMLFLGCVVSSLQASSDVKFYESFDEAFEGRWTVAEKEDYKAFGKSGDVTELRIGVNHKPETCEIQAHKGDRVKVHYKGQETESARYISKPYFEKYGILDDLQFDNFVRDEISLSSCVDEQPDVPKLTSLQRNLIGEGSHRRLSSVIRLEFEFSKSFCEVIIVEKLPSGVFADPFELQHLVQRSVFNDAAVFGDTNLELPSFRSNRSLVEIHVELNFDNLSAKNKQLELKIQLPLHARYAPLGQRFETIKFGNPTILLRGCRKESDSDQSCMVEAVADYGSKSESVHIAWEVPCGSKERAGIVSFVTFMSAIISAFLIVLTSLRHSNFMVSDATK